jgi:Integrase core domain/Protein of unknown function (DUF1349)
MTSEVSMETFKLQGVPGDFSCHLSPASWHLDGEDSLVVRSGPKNDYLHDPASGSRVASDPAALIETSEPSFILGTHVSLVVQSTFDAGLIFVRTNDEHWAKFWLELSPGSIESFNRRFRDECLNEHWFETLHQARTEIARFRRDYNEVRPHGSIGRIPPAMLLSTSPTNYDIQ